MITVMNTVDAANVSAEEMNGWSVTDIARWCKENGMEIEIDGGRIVGVHKVAAA